MRNNDNDYIAALEELDYEFPGIRHDDSMTEYIEEQHRLKELKRLLIKAGIILVISICLITIAIKLFPVLLILTLFALVKHE
jgi:hypothetical protein